MALGIISPGFIKRSASQSISPSDQQLQPPKQRSTPERPSTRRTQSLSSPNTPSQPCQPQIHKQRNFPRPFNVRRTQSYSAPTQGSEPSPKSQQVGSESMEHPRRSQSCSLPAAGKDNVVRSRSTSLQEAMKIEDRARTFGGVPGTELTISGRRFWRSVLGSSARVRESDD